MADNVRWRHHLAVIVTYALSVNKRDEEYRSWLSTLSNGAIIRKVRSARSKLGKPWRSGTLHLQHYCRILYAPVLQVCLLSLAPALTRFPR